MAGGFFCGLLVSVGGGDGSDPWDGRGTRRAAVGSAIRRAGAGSVPVVNGGGGSHRGLPGGVGSRLAITKGFIQG